MQKNVYFYERGFQFNFGYLLFMQLRYKLHELIESGNYQVIYINEAENNSSSYFMALQTATMELKITFNSTYFAVSE